MDAIIDTPEITFDYETPLTETPEQRHARRLDHASHCFAPLRVRYKYDGTYHTFNKPCGEYRVCDKCRKYRAKLFKERAERCEWQAIAKSGCTRRAYLVYATPAHARAIIRREGKEWCFCIPSEGDVLMIVASEQEMGEQLTSEVTDRLDWERLCVTPEGKKVSGKLGSKAKPKVESDGTVTIMGVLLSGISLEAEAHAEELAVKETEYLRPSTVEELQAALDTRQKAFIAQVIKHGGKVVAYSHHREHVKLLDIDWSKYNSKMSERAVERAWSRVRQE